MPTPQRKFWFERTAMLLVAFAMANPLLVGGCLGEDERGPAPGAGAPEIPDEIATAYFAASCCENDDPCQDGVFCNGRETCNCWGECNPPGTASVACDDLDPCTTDFCDESLDTCTHTPIAGGLCGCRTTADCDDHMYCNGAELCDPTTSRCVSGAIPCPTGPCIACNETTDTCVRDATCCETSTECDDLQWCTGTETCNTTTHRCQPGLLPCTDRCTTCSEPSDTCNPLVGGSCATAADCCGSPGPCMDWACTGGTCNAVAHACPFWCGVNYVCQATGGVDICVPPAGGLCPGTPCLFCNTTTGACTQPYAAGSAPAGCCDASLSPTVCGTPAQCQMYQCNATTYACAGPVADPALDGHNCNTDGNVCTGRCASGSCNETLPAVSPRPAGCCAVATDCGGTTTCAWWNCPTTGGSAYTCVGPSYAAQLTPCVPPAGTGTCQIGVCTGPAGYTYTNPVGGGTTYYGPGLCIAIDQLALGSSCTSPGPISLGSFAAGDPTGATRQATGNNQCGHNTWYAGGSVGGTLCYEDDHSTPLGQTGLDLAYVIDINTSATDYQQYSYLVEVMSNFDGNVYVTKSSTCATGGAPPTSVTPQPCALTDYSATVVLEETCALPSVSQTCSTTGGCYIWCDRTYWHPTCGNQTWHYPTNIYDCSAPGYGYKAVHMIYPDSTDYGMSQRYYIYVDASSPGGLATTGDLLVRVTKQAWSSNPCDRNTDNLRLYNATGGGQFRGTIQNYVNDLHQGGGVCGIYDPTVWIAHFWYTACFSSSSGNAFWPAFANYLIDRRAIGGTQTYCIWTDENGADKFDTTIGVYENVSATFCDGWVSGVDCAYNSLGSNNGSRLEVNLGAGRYVVGVGNHWWRDYPCRSDCGDPCNYILHIYAGTCAAAGF